MSTATYLNELETERLAIESITPITHNEKALWWDRLGEWWHRRDIGFGDGKGMKSHCFAMAEKWKRIASEECEFCGAPATKAEQFDVDIFVCDQCSA